MVNVGKYTVRPMDASWERWRHDFFLENLWQDSRDHPFRSRDAVIALPLRPKERKWVLTKDPNLNQRQPLKPPSRNGSLA